MKKILVSILVAAMVGATLTGCGRSKEGNGSSVEQTSLVSAADVVEKMNEEGYVRMPTLFDENMLNERYGIDLSNIENYGVAMTGISPGPGLIVVLKAKDGKVDEVKAEADKILQTEIGSAFYPEEKEIAEKSKVEVNGKFVSLFILNDEVATDAAAKYQELIK